MRTQQAEIHATAVWAQQRSIAGVHPVKRVMPRFRGAYLRGAS